MSKPKPRPAESRRARSQGVPGNPLPARRPGTTPSHEARKRGSVLAVPTQGANEFALLLAAHGERRPGAANDGALQLAAALAERAAASAVAVGFLKGSPSIAESVQRLSSYDLLVYPLFLSDGYFTRKLLPRQLEEAGAFGRGRATCLLPPLGLDPALADLMLDEAAAAAHHQSWPTFHTNLVLLAHGSSNNPASRLATEQMAEMLAARAVFARVRVAFLEEPPSLQDAVSRLSEPVVVVGLFAGDGLHGGGDAPRLIAEIGRSDVVSAGNIGGFAALPDIIAETIRRRWKD
ncbi:MAG: CbiX/SirB N-terminal domain-containing protein [Xanthobacteraceae bacterium]